MILLTCLVAILICLEHSFWLTRQGSSPTEAFTQAFDTYVKDKRALVDQKLAAYWTSNGSDDWVTANRRPSAHERTEFLKIVHDNLLRKARPCLLQACVAHTIPAAHPRPSI